MKRPLSFVILRVLLFIFCFQHPVLDEPIAEAVCIIADTDKWTVQVASSQRRMIDNKLGKEVLVSSLVSNLLHSTLQLYKHNLSPNFVSMNGNREGDVFKASFRFVGYRGCKVLPSLFICGRNFSSQCIL